METNTCPDCGKENVKRMDLHKINCPKNPAKGDKKDQPIQVAPEVPSVSSISITNVMEYMSDDEEMAWFVTEDGGERISKPINYMGTFSDGKTSLQTVLVLVHDGTLQPPFMIAGFLGIFPESFKFPEQEEIPETELQPPAEEKQPEPAQTTEQLIEKFKQKDNAVVKPSFMDKLRGRKAKEPEPNGLDPETLALLKQIPTHA